jgi:hypothetical protein
LCSDGVAVRQGPWWLVDDYGHEGWKLYNIESAPTEDNNPLDEQPEKVKELKAEIEEWKQRMQGASSKN